MTWQGKPAALRFHGVISCFPTRLPSKRELRDCHICDVTSPDAEWNPHSSFLDEQENSCRDYLGNVPKCVKRDRSTFAHSSNALRHQQEHAQCSYDISAASTRALHNISNTSLPHSFTQAVNQTKSNVDLTPTSTIEPGDKDTKALDSGDQRNISPE